MSLLTADGINIIPNWEHLEQHKPVVPLLAEACAQIELLGATGKIQRVTVDMGRVVGISDRVETGPADVIVYAVREGRSGLSRLVKNRRGKATNNVTLILLRQRKCWRLLSAWVGDRAEREPDDTSIKTQAEWDVAYNFWSKNALVYNAQAIVPGSESSGWKTESTMLINASTR